MKNLLEFLLGLLALFVVLPFILILRGCSWLAYQVGRWLKTPLHKDRKSPLYGWQLEELPPATHLPWAAVLMGRHQKKNSDPALPYLTDPCPQCQSEKVTADHRTWIFYTSSPQSWRRNYGREGYISVCTKHKIQVSFTLSAMN